MFLLYIVIILLGIFSSYTDIRFKIIKNRHLLSALFAGIGIYIYLIFDNKISPNINLIINPLIGLIIGLLFYFTNIWSAGDAKLFFVFTLLMPSQRYTHILAFPALAVFISIFLLSTGIILILSIKQILLNKNHILSRIISFETLFRLVNSFLIIFSLGWLISFLIQPLRLRLAPIIIVLILFFSYLFVYRLVNKFKKSYIIPLIFAGGVISRFLAQPQDFSLISVFVYFRRIFFYTLLFYILNIFFDLNKNQKENIIPFAPVMFLGTLLANTNFLWWVMRLLSMLRR